MQELIMSQLAMQISFGGRQKILRKAQTHADYIIFKPKIPHPTTPSSSKLTSISQVL
jgi:hypothetical protein